MAAMEVLGGVFADRGVAATHMSAFEAQAQVHPFLANLQTLLATLRCTGRHGSNFTQMRTGCHGIPSINGQRAGLSRRGNWRNGEEDAESGCNRSYRVFLTGAGGEGQDEIDPP